MWADWTEEMGSDGFRALVKTVWSKIEGILRAISTGANDGYRSC